MHDAATSYSLSDKAQGEVTEELMRATCVLCPCACALSCVQSRMWRVASQNCAPFCWVSQLSKVRQRTKQGLEGLKKGEKSTPKNNSNNNSTRTEQGASSGEDCGAD